MRLATDQLPAIDPECTCDTMRLFDVNAVGRQHFSRMSHGRYLKMAEFWFC
ncbi:hypothetical protein AFE_1571 [Acidithiobacillus ferrooxidans ATCC 23270]|uniref:Uncharacterized protein n=1 Tax=Acidithiobacillus ferrooxidans (strain ATCC 23270 / DSM 14882 / CIP 104768 / NCIMB 8455) TaxID=243159 RepID=B7JAE7_ACIF2|nr:hypothetical protein AFE_1571 [Acidithiobacillus ferrooxidans ATCC 23270]